MIGDDGVGMLRSSAAPSRPLQVTQTGHLWSCVWWASVGHQS